MCAGPLLFEQCYGFCEVPSGLVGLSCCRRAVGDVGRGRGESWGAGGGLPIAHACAECIMCCASVPFLVWDGKGLLYSAEVQTPQDFRGIPVKQK